MEKNPNIFGPKLVRVTKYVPMPSVIVLTIYIRTLNFHVTEIHFKNASNHLTKGVVIRPSI